MNWKELHTESERLAGKAELACRDDDQELARRLYAEAAELETRALETLDRNKTRTLGISAVSAVCLWYKARKCGLAQQTAYRALATGLLPEFAARQLRDLLQVIWSERFEAESGEPDPASAPEAAAITNETLHGVLRALHLDQDWLELAVGDEHVMVREVGDSVDDVIGRMVNRAVVVETFKDHQGHYLLRDIDLEA